MANTVTVKKATRSRLTILIIGDGTATETIASATLLAAMKAGPLKTRWNATYASQALMRAALLEDHGKVTIRPRAHPVDTTAQNNQIAADVDADAVTATKAELNLQLHDTAGQAFYVDIEVFGVGA